MNKTLTQLIQRLDDMAVGIPRLAQVSGSLKDELARTTDYETEIHHLKDQNKRLQAELEDALYETLDSDGAHETNDKAFDWGLDDPESWLRWAYRRLGENGQTDVLEGIRHLMNKNGLTI